MCAIPWELFIGGEQSDKIREVLVIFYVRFTNTLVTISPVNRFFRELKSVNKQQ